MKTQVILGTLALAALGAPNYRSYQPTTASNDVTDFQDGSDQTDNFGTDNTDFYQPPSYSQRKPQYSRYGTYQSSSGSAPRYAQTSQYASQYAQKQASAPVARYSGSQYLPSQLPRPYDNYQARAVQSQKTAPVAPAFDDNSDNSSDFPQDQTTDYQPPASQTTQSAGAIKSSYQPQKPVTAYDNNGADFSQDQTSDYQVPPPAVKQPAYAQKMPSAPQQQPSDTQDDTYVDEQAQDPQGTQDVPDNSDVAPPQPVKKFQVKQPVVANDQQYEPSQAPQNRHAPVKPVAIPAAAPVSNPNNTSPDNPAVGKERGEKWSDRAWEYISENCPGLKLTTGDMLLKLVRSPSSFFTKFCESDQGQATTTTASA